MALSGGIMDAVAGHDDPAQTPITASSFEPTSIPNPRAWERVAVPPVGHARQRKIWKRVGGFPTNALPQSYLSAMAELESNGDVARKRARTARFVPVFGDAQWDPRHNQPREGESVLADARVSASAELEDASPSEDGARFIPRKRHSSGWPIEPETGVAAPTEPVLRDQTKIRQRSLRRFSRRISLSTIAEESPRHLEHISLSPAKRTPGPAVSPTKRAVITSSPTKVAESPRRLFMVDLPRSDLLLQSPTPTLATMSPAKSSPPPVSGSTPQKDTTDPSLTTDQETTTAESSPLIFDQPIPAIQVEPQYETRRKISLLSAKRSDRRSSGFRTVDFNTARAAPKRRHSFNPAQSAPAEVTSRRTSLDFLSSMPDEAHPLTTVDEEGDSVEKAQELPNESTQAFPVAYEVDVGTNLDIFGQIRHVPSVKTSSQPTSDLSLTNGTIFAEKALAPSSPASTVLHTSSPVEKILHPSSPLQNIMPPSSPIEKCVSQHVTPLSPCVEVMVSPPSPAENIISASSPPKTTSPIRNIPPPSPTERSIHSSSPVTTTFTPSSPVVQKDAVVDPASEIDAGVTDNVTNGADKADETSCLDLANETSSSSEDGESPSAELDTPQSDLEFEPHEPEGLSTIYEESGIDTTSPQKPVDEDVNSTETVAEVNDTSILTAEDLSEIQVIRALDVAANADETKEVATTSELVQCNGNVNESSSPANHVQDEAPTTPTGNALSIPHPPEGISDETTLQNSSELSPASPDQSTPSSYHLSADMEIDESKTTSIPVAPAPPSTPEKATVSESTIVSQQGGTLGNRDSSGTSGFTPVNGRQISPTSVTTTPIEAPNDTASGLDAMVAEPDEDVIMTDIDNIATEVDDEHPVNVTDLAKAGNDTITLARYDDADFVRDFVSRVAAGKSAKAAAAAAVATEPPRKVGRPKRLSGSTTSTTTSTGSPVSKSDSPKRTPLTEKSANSPSPLKKRKLEDEEETAQPGGESEDGDDAPKVKRRRKRADPVVEETASAKPEAEADAGAAPRRSTRARSTRISLRSAGPSANSIARSLYPIGRRPGGLSGMIEDPDLDGQSNLSRQRSETKSTEALTRSNTRANKSGAVHPHVLLARLAEDPTWKMKELKGVFDAKESRLAADGKSKKAKGVRWDSELVRYQDDNSSNKVFKTMAKSLLADIMNGDGVDEEDELALPTPTPTPTVQPALDEENTPPAEKPLPAKKSTAPARRTRSSRLQAPTPVKKLASGSGIGGSDSKSSNIISPPTVIGPVRAAKTTKAPKAAAKSIPTPTASTSTSSTTKASSSSSSGRAGMATRRTKIASLGMGVNGTPAPKRRGRTTS